MTYVQGDGSDRRAKEEGYIGSWSSACFQQPSSASSAASRSSCVESRHSLRRSTRSAAASSL